ncbi:MAG: hypothetical protein HPY68_09445, partial [Candidatus Atribacteria bacterium]|nr:hypothetical protein [Candidatus Atribacteria bacterium]
MKDFAIEGVHRVTGRERALKALNHEVPDRVPLDLGTTNCTTMTRVAYENLKRLL